MRVAAGLGGGAVHLRILQRPQHATGIQDQLLPAGAAGGMIAPLETDEAGVPQRGSLAEAAGAIHCVL